MSFSGVLQLTDLDDFVGPGQTCIKPMLDASSSAVPSSSATVSTAQSPLNKKARRIEIGADGGATEIDLETGTETKLAKASITLSDCLACAGCVTSAESVLVNAQSVAEFKKKVGVIAAASETSNSGVTTAAGSSCEDAGFDNVQLVVSVSPQSTAALAAKFDVPVAQCFPAVQRFLTRRFGALAVLDTNFARELSIRETAVEFLERLQRRLQDEQVQQSSAAQRQPDTLISSACPGYVCYAEKTHGTLLLPHMARSKSPQQIIGALVKRVLPGAYHVTVMPCYDKKLEAARDDFLSADTGAPDVDCVLTTSELLELIEEYSGGVGGCGDSLSFITADQQSGTARIGMAGDGPLASLSRLSNDRLLLATADSGGSGGYAESVMRIAAAELNKSVVSDSHDEPPAIVWKPQRNKDFLVAELPVRVATASGGQSVLRLKFAIMNGFRNIQTLVRRLKTKKLPYDFVEVMACPSGCLNGGGQIKGDAALLSTVSARYSEFQPLPSPLFSDRARQLYQEIGQENASILFRTKYHVRDQPLNPLQIKW